MPINKNHEFEELNGIKCGIVERNISAGRAEFLKKLLEFNRFTVVIVPAATPKVSMAPVAKAEESAPLSPPITTVPAPETFTIGVTDITFNPVNAIFGRLLKTPRGSVVTQAYWLQKEPVSLDEIPYYEKKI